jgi:hypothetical protein
MSVRKRTLGEENVSQEMAIGLYVKARSSAAGGTGKRGQKATPGHTKLETGKAKLENRKAKSEKRKAKVSHTTSDSGNPKSKIQNLKSQELAPAHLI